VPKTHHGDYAIYAVADQIVWISPEDNDRTISVFVRPMGTPQADRNLVDFSVDAGVNFKEPIKHRDDDTLGIGMGYAHASSRASGLDKDQSAYTPGYPSRSGETFVEVSYQYQRLVWWQLQPDFQYVFNPGAGVPNPNSSTGQRVKNEVVLGLRMNFAF
jgi:porin